jgi:LuxR family maltose regulon positive regulatory protein
MTAPLLSTKLYIPPVRPRERVVPRPRLIERLNEGLPRETGGFARKLTLVSAPAGFGKTTLVSEWIHRCFGAGTGAGRGEVTSPLQPLQTLHVAWLSLDDGDNDLARFLAYFIAALQTVAADIGKGASGVLQASGPQPPPTESILTALINDIAAYQDDPATGSGRGLILALDDYHVIESREIDKALAFTLEHLPPRMHLVIVSRMDPTLPLSRLRAGGQMTEIREDDLRFSADEINTFLDKVMGLDLSPDKVAALETRTEGWIAGLQLAALSMQGLGRDDKVADFVDRFTGSDRYIQDYLADEVLRQRPEGTQDFLLQTSILDRLSGPLCDAVRFGGVETAASFGGVETAGRTGGVETAGSTGGTPAGEASLSNTGRKNSQAILEALDAANLFIVPLDNERRWYRYHHLFADLLRQRLHQQQSERVAQLHLRASAWYEENGLELEAFQHAAAADDVEQAERLMEGDGMPLPFRGAVVPVLNWLRSLPTAVLDARPLLWVTYASTLLATGQRTGVEERLQAAEAALGRAEPDATTQDLTGRIAAIRATMAVAEQQVEAIIALSRRALEDLHPDNVAFRTSTAWKLGYAYHVQGDRAAARQAYTEAMTVGQASGNIIFTASAIVGLGSLQEAENQLHLAAESYRRALHLFGDQPLPTIAGEAHQGLARVYYAWNDLDAAERHGLTSVQLVQQTETNNSYAAYEVFIARLKLAQGDLAGAAAILAHAEQFVSQHHLVHRMPEVAAAQVLTSLHQGDLERAAYLAQTHELPISQARVHLAQGDPPAALARLEPLCRQAEAKGWEDERLKMLALQAVAHHAHGDEDQALRLLGDALALAEPGGFIRLFVDEGLPMAELLSVGAARGIMLDYTNKLLAAFDDATQHQRETKEIHPPSAVFGRPSPAPSLSQPAPSLSQPAPSLSQPAPSLSRGEALVEPLSERELEVLQLIADGLSNREISERLFLALSTVKGHNRNIYGKLGVHRRTEAVARARELGLL